ncbi:MAG: serine/threonine protein phosphatase [Eubacterium sp.]|nr:serine/threonine protein phosphatase [Eubacterium sp.]
MRTIVIGDIHGCHKEAKILIDILIKEDKYCPDKDRLIFIGDYIDRGENPRLAVRYVRELQEKYGNKVIALMGNHEDMLLAYMTRHGENWLYNGYSPTLASYRGHEEEFRDDMEWMAGLPLYYEDDDFVYVHAGVDKDIPMEEQLDDTMLWTRSAFYQNPKAYSKKVIFGHTPTLFLGNTVDPLWLNDGNDIAIDTGCVFHGRLTGLIIEDGQILMYYQVDSRNPGHIIRQTVK